MQLKEGFCSYCKDGRMVEVPDDATQKEVNEEVTKKCNCPMAARLRNLREQKEACMENIEEMLEENYPEIAKIFKENIANIQENRIKKITVNTHSNQTARMSKTKDGIKVELEKKQKNESLA